MARSNPKLTYPQGTLFIRRDPDKTTEWQVVDGSWEVTDGKRTGFNCTVVLESGIASGKLARSRADVLITEAKAAQTA